MTMYAMSWRDPVEDPPKEFVSVILKLSNEKNDITSYEVAFYAEGKYYGHGNLEWEPKDIISWALIPGEL